jgi:hypothetical protein
VKKNQFPKGWDERRVRRVLSHYEAQSEEEQAAEDEEAFADRERTVVEIPVELMPLIRQIVAQHWPSKT